MPYNSVSLAVIDDHALFRKTLKGFLHEQSTMRVVMEASDVHDMFTKLKSIPVDIVLMDIFMPGVNGNEAVKTIRRTYPAMKVIMLSMNSRMEIISDLLDAGIHGYVSKADEPEELLQAIRAVSEGRIYRNKLFTEALYRNKQNDIRTFSAKTSITLSDREKRILQLIWEEKSNKEIADELFLGIRSVEKIRQDLKEKLEVKSTVGLLKYAIDKKIIEVNPLLI